MKFKLRVLVFVSAGLILANVLLFHPDLITAYVRFPGLSDDANTSGDMLRRSDTSSHTCRDVGARRGSRAVHQSLSSGIGKATCDFNTWDLLRQADEVFGKFSPVFDGWMPPKQPVELVVTKPKTRPLRVFVVPHSHNDPGWLKTLDGYYKDQTKTILDSMVEKLVQYPNMTFIWVESVFLHLWWSEIQPETKELMSRFIKERRIEIVSGGWVMPDEANPTYYALIDQLIEGHQWLEKTLSVKPNNSWSVDPFGYSSTLAYISEKAGFKNMAIQRIHRNVKDILAKQQSLEFKWRQHWDALGEHDMFTIMMPGTTYTIVDTCGPDRATCREFDFRDETRRLGVSSRRPVKEGRSQDKAITEANVAEKAKTILNQYYQKAKQFKHSALLMPIGADFRFDDPLEWDDQYKNYQLLINYMNSQPEWNVKAQFGILQDYFDAVHEEIKDEAFPTLDGDFYPYLDNVFWTGYFTTRAFQKRLCRELESHLRTSDMLLSFAVALARQRGHKYPNEISNVGMLQQAHRSLGLFQHHDAITGTSKAFVMADYESRLQKSLVHTDAVIEESMQYLLPGGEQDKFVITLDDSHEIKIVASARKLLEVRKHQRDLVVFNPIAHEREQVIHVLVDSELVAVFDESNCTVPSQLQPFWMNDTAFSHVIFELIFYVQIGPLSTRTFNVRTVSALDMNQPQTSPVSVQIFNGNLVGSLPPRFKILPAMGATIDVENAIYHARFTASNGFLESMTSKLTNLTTSIHLQFLIYTSQSSGAYTFRPRGPADDKELNMRPIVRVLRGPLVSEVQSLQQFVRHTVKIYHTTSTIGWAMEIENVVDLRSTMNREMVMRFNTDVGQSSEYFFVDSNSLHISRRGRLVKHPLEANFYPMNSMAYLEESNKRISIHSTQPHGCTSLAPGQLEIMLDRILQRDDGKGLEQGVTDNKVTPSRFYLTLEARLDPSKSRKDISFPSLLGHTLNNYLNKPLFSLFLENRTLDTRPYFPFDVAGLPCDVRLVAVRPIPEAGPTYLHSFIVILHRVVFDEGFPTDMLDCISTLDAFTLSALLPGGMGSKVTSVKEMTLSLLYEKRSLDLNTRIILQPMDMVTFKITF